MADNKMFGYIRVSTKEQNEGRQRKEMLDLGIDERDIFMDKQSGKNFKRKNYQTLRDHLLREGDLLVISSIDRFGRNYTEILEEWRHITKVVRADILVLDMPLLDTRQRTGADDATRDLINDIILQLLSYVAEKQRDNIRKSQRDGIDLALENGVRFGRPEREFPEGWAELYKKWKADEIRAVDFYRQLGLSSSSFYVLVSRYIEMGEKLEQPETGKNPI